MKFKLITMLLLCTFGMCKAQNGNREVLELLDLNGQELGNVKKAYDAKNYSLAVDELLKYYRNRPAMEGFVDRSEKKASLGKAIGGIDKKWADDSLKNIFVGQKSYPSFFLGNDIDWHTNPVDDIEWIHQLHRMYWWPSMGRAYWNSGDEKYAKSWVYQFTDWKKKNPKGVMPAWAKINTGSRIYTLAEVFEFFIESPNFTSDVLVCFLESIHQQTLYLYENYTPIGNHKLIEAKGVLCAGVIFHEFKEAPLWRKDAIKVFNEEIDKQVFDDGMQFELSTSYHSGVIALFLDAMILAEINGYAREFPSSYVETVEKMIRANYVFSLPDFTVAQFGDSWKGDENKLSNLFKKWVKYFPRDDFIYFSTKGEQGSVPKETSVALKDAGFYTFRNGWGKDSTVMILKCGPEAFFHAQPDNGGFELYAKGRHFMPDSGCYIYSGDDNARQWFRRTASHQTLTLNNENTECKPNLIIWQTSNTFDALVIENQSYENLLHRRAVFFNKDFFVLVDDAIGGACGDVRIHFQFMPCEAIFDGLTASTDFQEGANLIVQSSAQDGIELEKEDGWVSYEYTKKQPRPAFCYKLNKQNSKSVRFVTVLFPYTGKMPKININGNTARGSMQAALEVDIDGKSYRFGYDLNDKTVIYNCPKGF